MEIAMSFPRESESHQPFSDINYDDDKEALSHKKRVRRMLEERLERKRLKEEFDEMDGEFDWDEFER